MGSKNTNHVTILKEQSQSLKKSQFVTIFDQLYQMIQVMDISS